MEAYLKNVFIGTLIMTRDLYVWPLRGEDLEPERTPSAPLGGVAGALPLFGGPEISLSRLLSRRLHHVGRCSCQLESEMCPATSRSRSIFLLDIQCLAGTYFIPGTVASTALADRSAPSIFVPHVSVFSSTNREAPVALAFNQLNLRSLSYRKAATPRCEFSHFTP